MKTLKSLSIILLSTLILIGLTNIGYSAEEETPASPEPITCPEYNLCDDGTKAKCFIEEGMCTCETCKVSDQELCMGIVCSEGFTCKKNAYHVCYKDYGTTSCSTLPDEPCRTHEYELAPMVEYLDAFNGNKFMITEVKADRVYLGGYSSVGNVWVKLNQPYEASVGENIITITVKHIALDVTDTGSKDRVSLLIESRVAEPTEEKVCSDSDGGKNYYVNGVVTATNDFLTYEDRCSYGRGELYNDDPNMLFEAYCFEDEFGYGYDYYSCPNGCKNGVCIPIEECPIGCTCTETTIACGGGGGVATPVTTEVPAEECPKGCTCTEEGVSCGAVRPEKRITCRMGCALADKCVVQGTRVKIDEINSYCSLDRDFEAQKAEGEECQNSYECTSNFCSNGACYDIAGEMRETRGLLERVISFLSNLFGFGG